MLYVVATVAIVAWTFRYMSPSSSYGMHKVSGYTVRDPTDTKTVENLKHLSKITTDLFSIIQDNPKYASHKGLRRIVDRFKCPDGICRIQELSYENYGHVAYSEDKGGLIGMCMIHEGKHVDENTMVFVYLHELSHIMSQKYGHDKEFWNNFQFLLEIAINHRLYTYEPYHKLNVTYCGHPIEFTPYIKPS